jgi:hypothetical protein
MIPARYSQLAVSFVLSGMMSLIVSGISTLKALGPVEGFVAAWAGNWAFSWAVAFPAVLVVAPLARRLVARLTVEDGGGDYRTT